MSQKQTSKKTYHNYGMMAPANRHIVVTDKNYRALESLGAMHETFDAVITRLLEERTTDSKRQEQNIISE